MISRSVPPDFVSLTTETAYLEAEVARQLVTDAAAANVSPQQIALKRGLLSIEQVEILEILLAPDDSVPGYQILSLLGSGGMGAVFRARQRNLDRLVALKTVLLSKGVGPAALARFEQEAITLAKLVHPNIVSAYDFGREGSKLFLALEFVDGEDADKFIRRRGALEETLVWSLIRQAAAGLAHARRHGIVHRDIKPANLLLVAPPAGFPLPKGVPLVKITDFGLALLQSEIDDRTRLTTAGTAVGSPNYMAPEQITGEPLDHRADMYALGATAYHFLAGRAPFAGMTLSAVFGQKLTTGPQALEQLMPTLSSHTLELVKKLTAVKPQDRFAEYEDLLERLDRWSSQVHDRLLEADRLAAEPTAPSIRPSGYTLPGVNVPQPTRRKWLWTSAAGTAALAALGAGVWTFGPRGPAIPPGQFYQPAAYGEEVALFTGESLQGWQVQGEWQPEKTKDWGMVLAGSRGAAERKLPSPRQSTTPRSSFAGYRVTMVVHRHTAQRAIIEFDLPDAAVGLWHELELSVGEFAANAATTAAAGGKKRVVRTLASDTEAVQVQWVRYSRGWLVLLNEEPLCEFAALHEPPSNRIRLRVEGGQAWFSDITVAAAM